MFCSAATILREYRVDELIVRVQLGAHDQLVDAMLPKYGGRRAKHTGDGVFALFDGPTNAARCALASCQPLQREEFESASAFMSANARSVGRNGVARPFTLERESTPWPDPEKYWQAALFATSRPARA